VAVNCCFPPGPKVNAVGLTVTLTVGVGGPVGVGVGLGAGGGTSVTAADADLVASAFEVAVTVMICCVVIELGAVYNPADEIVPTSGLADHTTPVVDPVTAATNGCVPDGPSETEVGVTETEIDGGGGGGGGADPLS